MKTVSFQLCPRSRHRVRWFLLVSCCCMMLVAAGCGKGKHPWEDVVTATGRITFGGQPLEGLEVTLFPVSSQVPDTVRPTARTDSEGRFVLGTWGTSDGAPSGEYKLSAVWFRLVNSNGSMVRGDNVLPHRYASPDTSGITVTIGESDTEIPTIDLKH